MMYDTADINLAVATTCLTSGKHVRPENSLVAFLKTKDPTSLFTI